MDCPKIKKLKFQRDLSDYARKEVYKWKNHSNSFTSPKSILKKGGKRRKKSTNQSRMNFSSNSELETSDAATSNKGDLSDDSSMLTEHRNPNTKKTP